MAIAVTTIPNPGDFFGVVVSGAGIVVAGVWGMEVVGAGGTVVITAVVRAVVGLVVGDVVITVVGTNVAWVVGFVVGTFTPIRGLNSVLSILVLMVSVFPVTS